MGGLDFSQSAGVRELVDTFTPPSCEAFLAIGGRRPNAAEIRSGDRRAFDRQKGGSRLDPSIDIYLSVRFT
jgi:hypothetical protein